MKTIPTDIADLMLLEPQVFSDDRGWFMESYNRHTLAALGIHADFVQDNHSHSVAQTLRGLHYQIHQPQGKLVRVVLGEIFDVAVDIRRSSPTFGQWAGYNLSASNRRMFWIPPGFAHGFLALSSADVLYKTTDFYTAQYDRTIVWNDLDLAIAWPLEGTPVMSLKDQAAPSFKTAECYP